MSRQNQLLTLGALFGVSVLFGMLVGTSINHTSAVAAEAGGEPKTVQAMSRGGGASPVAVPASLPLAQPIVAPSFADIAERAIPAIVAIQNTEFVKRSQNQMPRGQNQMPMDPWHFFLPDPEQDQRGPDGQGDEGESEEDRRDGSGSGFIISKDGYILTNNHVIAGASKITVTLTDGQKYPATVKGKDASIDIALIKIDAPQDLPTLPLGDSGALRTGEWVVAIGNPLGYDHSVTVGVVSGKGRPLNGLNQDRGLANYIQTDAAINFGNSGGPLLNARGEVIGINTAITRNYPGYTSGVVQGIGFALPIDHAKAVLDQLMTTGKVSRGYLSIQIEPIDESKKKYFGLRETKGAFVNKVNEDGPAGRAGVRNEDVIVSVDGKPVDTTESLIQMISAHRPGDTVTLGLLRCRESGGDACNGREISVKVKLADRTETLRASNEGGGEEQGGADEDEPASVAKLGFTAADLTPNRFREMWAGRAELPKGHPDGVLVTKVSSSAPAYEAGLQPGWIITQVGREPIKSLADFRRAADKIQKGQVVRLAVTFFLPPSQRGEGLSPESRFIFFEAD